MSVFSSTKKVAFIKSSWHADHVETAARSCHEELIALGEDAETVVESYKLPGVLEIPLMTLHLGLTGRYGAIIGFGIIADGGIYHPEYVSSAVIGNFCAAGLDIRRSTGQPVPAISCMLSPWNFREDREDPLWKFLLDHMRVKGREAARAAVQAATVMTSVNSD